MRNQPVKLLGYPFILTIKLYRRFISPLFPPRCKFYPTCSTYALECFSQHNPLKALILSMWRLLRCNPFSLGGVDYVPKPGTWRRPEYKQMSDTELAEHWAKLASLEKDKKHNNETSQ